jgi:Flp pilus assembly protein TadG
MPSQHSPQLTSERGATLIHVAIGLLMLFGFSAFVLDQGVLYLARREAQNAADAGAHAGAVAMLFDDSSNLSATGPAFLNADTIARSSLVMSEEAGIHVDLAADTGSWETPPPPVCAANPGTCVQVDVYRDGTHDSTPLPTYFSNIWGYTSQNVRATATAQVRAANYSECIKPFMIPDTDPVTGIPYTADAIGTPVTLSPGNPGEAIEPSNYFQIGPSAATFPESITGCVIEGGIGSPMDSLPGFSVGPVIMNTQAVIDADPGASVSNGIVTGSCAPHCVGYEGKPTSPRIWAISMFDMAEYDALGRPSGNFQLHITNILAIFVVSVGRPPDAPIQGVIVGDVGVLKTGPTVDIGSSFLHVVQLIR